MGYLQFSHMSSTLPKHWLPLLMACIAGGACRSYPECHQAFRSHMAVPSFGKHGEILDAVCDTWVDSACDILPANRATPCHKNYNKWRRSSKGDQQLCCILFSVWQQLSGHQGKLSIHNIVYTTSSLCFDSELKTMHAGFGNVFLLQQSHCMDPSHCELHLSCLSGALSCHNTKLGACSDVLCRLLICVPNLVALWCFTAV